MRCRNCRKNAHLHIDSKCPFDSTNLDLMTEAEEMQYENQLFVDVIRKVTGYQNFRISVSTDGGSNVPLASNVAPLPKL